MLGSSAFLIFVIIFYHMFITDCLLSLFFPFFFFLHFTHLVQMHLVDLLAGEPWTKWWVCHPLWQRAGYRMVLVGGGDIPKIWHVTVVLIWGEGSRFFMLFSLCLHVLSHMHHTGTRAQSLWKSALETFFAFSGLVHKQAHQQLPTAAIQGKSLIGCRLFSRYR